jgi:CheY-like chemotaxis protein
MRILIADDEVMSRRLLQKTSERAGYEVTAVENGRLAADGLGDARAGWTGRLPRSPEKDRAIVCLHGVAHIQRV